MARVTGIGGIFLRARNPRSLSAWYAKHLHLQLSAHGTVNFLWSDEETASLPPGMTVWSTFPADTTYFGPGTPSGPQTVMVNYRVDDLDALLAELSTSGVPVDPQREDYSYGRFAWITDPEGNRIELWQPLPDPDTPST